MKDPFIQSFVTKNYYTLRTLAGLTTNELADLTGTTRQTINSLENGKTKLMNKTLLVATKAVLSEIADNNNNDELNLALLKFVLDFLSDGKIPTGRNLVLYDFSLISEAFLAAAIIIDAKFSLQNLDELCEAIFRVMLKGDLYEATGLSAFFAKRKEKAEQSHTMFWECANKKCEEEIGNGENLE